MAVAGQGSPLARQIKTATVANVDLLAAVKSHPSVVAEQVSFTAAISQLPKSV